MLQGILVALFTFLISYLIIGALTLRYPNLSRRFMMILFGYHFVLAIAYYLYALYNPSDSAYYYAKAVRHFLGDNLFDYFGISTRFIDFISFFLVNDLGLTYESCMAVFSWLGFMGFLFFYIFFTERIVTRPRLFGYNLLWILFLLPNPHFWASSIGKGSVIFFGLGLFFFALNRLGYRWWALLLGGWIIFQIRPHIFYVLLIAVALGYTFSTRGVALGYRILILGLAVFLLYSIYEDIVRITGLEDESLFDPFISHRASELTKATSGIDITHYSVPEKLFAFWFRPIFYDAPGTLGIIVSFENLFYLFFFIQLLRPKAIRYLWNGDAIVKTCFITFLGVSFAMAQISGNLGIALRQKSQVMMLMLFVILRFLDDEKLKEIKKLQRPRPVQKEPAIKARVPS